MAPEWPSATVIDLQNRGVLLVEDGNHGEYRPRENEFGSGNMAFIRAADMEGGRVLFETASRINDMAVARIRKGFGRGGDVLFSHKGTVGKLALVPADAPPFVCSPQTTFWRTLDEAQLDRRFLYAFMRSSAFIEQWDARKGETDMADYVSLTAQREFTVAIPPIEEQRAIGALLGALDDKIDLNRRMNRTLEETASALFRSWFVDFDPVVAKAAGRAPFGMDSAMADQFPSAFEDSRLGPIPRGWAVTKLSDFGDWRSGATPRRDASAAWVGDVPWISAKSMHHFCVQTSDEHVDPAASDGRAHLVPAGSTLFVVRGMSLADEFRVGMTDRAVAFNQDLKAIVPNGAVAGVLIGLFLLHSRADVLDLVDEAGHGTKKLETDRIEALALALPRPDVQARLAVPMCALFDLMCANQTESRTLSAVRDALLPKLFSGEIRLRDAERLVEAAL